MELTKRKYFLLSLFLSYLVASFVQFRAIFDDTAVHTSVRYQIYWMARLINPNLFPNDIIADHFAQPKMISPILGLIYSLVPKNIEPSEITQLIPLILVLISTIFLFKATELRFGARYAFWLCLCFNLGIWTIDNLAGGLQRAFFFPLFFLFLWLFAKGSSLGIVLILLAEAFIYPISFIISIVIILLSLGFQIFLRNNTSENDSKTMASTSIKKNNLIKIFLISIPAGIGLIYIRYLYFTDLLVSAYLNEEQIFKSYLELIIPMLLIIIFSKLLLHSENYLNKIESNKAFLHILKKRSKLILSGIALLVSFSFWDDHLIKINKEEYRIYKFLSNLEEDALITAPLKLADNIPMFSYRSVLVNSSAKLAAKNKYKVKMTERLKDLETIFHTENTELLKNLINKYGIDYLVVENAPSEQINQIAIFHTDTYGAKLLNQTKNFSIIKINPNI